jgi:excinuclease UvrABC helicase subunit UvrB
MFEQAKNLAFEEAAGLRDQIEELRQQFVRS